MKLSIIIINYNTGRLIKNCIESIINETKRIDFEILIINNNSSENLANYISTFSNVIVIHNDKNIGFGAANNIGIKHSKGEYILLLNPDTIVIDKAIEKSVRFMEKHPKTGLLGCQLLNEDKTVQQSVFHESSLIKYLFNSNPLVSKIIQSKKKFDYSINQKVTGVSGAFMLFRKSVFNNLKPFDPDIFMYSEETELCRNRISKYWDIYYYKDAKIIHLGGKSAPKDIRYYQALLSYSLIWYKKGIFHYSYYLMVIFINLFSSLFGYLFAGERGKKDLKIYLKGYLKIFPYLFFDIPMYKRSWGSRKEPLKLSEIE